MTELIGQLVSNLGVDEGQAKGGLGAILNLAKDKLDGGDFSKITDAISGSSELMSAAPEAKAEGGGLGGMLGSVTSALGVGGNLGNLASLAGAFSSLNLDASMIGKFAPVVMGFLKEKGGDALPSILEKVMK